MGIHRSVGSHRVGTPVTHVTTTAMSLMQPSESPLERSLVAATATNAAASASLLLTSVHIDFPVPPFSFRYDTVVVPHGPHAIGDAEAVHLPRERSRFSRTIHPGHATDDLATGGRSLRREGIVGLPTTSVAATSTPLFQCFQSPTVVPVMISLVLLLVLVLMMSLVVVVESPPTPACRPNLWGHRGWFLPRLGRSGTHTTDEFPLVRVTVVIIDHPAAVRRAGCSIDLAGIPPRLAVLIDVGHTSHVGPLLLLLLEGTLLESRSVALVVAHAAAPLDASLGGMSIGRDGNGRRRSDRLYRLGVPVHGLRHAPISVDGSASTVQVGAAVLP